MVGRSKHSSQQSNLRWLIITQSIFIIFCCEENTNKNDSEIPSYTYCNGKIKSTSNNMHGEVLGRNRDAPPLLVGVQPRTATLEMNVENPQQIGNQFN